VFAGYIAFCAKEGIINGYTDGTFRPAGQLTGYAFLKMLLGALGYDAEIEGYTGVSNWGINVAKQAIGIGLVDGNDDFAGTKTVTREEACLYALNTLQATMVDYDSKTTVTVNGAAVVIGNSKAYEVENTAKVETFKDDNKMQFAEKYFTDLKTVDTTDDFGRPADKWMLKNKEIGTFTKDADATYTAGVKGKTIKADTGINANDYYTWNAVLDGKSVKVPSGFNSDIADDWYGYITKNGDYSDKKIGGNGALTQVFLDDDDEEATVTVINTYVLQVSGDYDENDEELTLAAVDGDDSSPASVPAGTELTLSADDFDNLDQFEDEDIVLVTVAGKEIKSIAKAEKVSGTVDSYVYKDSVTVDGTKYEYSAKGDKTVTYDKDAEIDMYLDAYGYVIYTEASEGTSTYVYVAEFGNPSGLKKNGNVSAYAYFTDGTEDTITVSKVDKVSANYTTLDSTYPNGGWFKYTEKNGKYELTKVTTTTDKTAASGDYITDYKDKSKNDMLTMVDVGSTQIKATKDTVFVVVDKDDNVKSYTGIKNVPTTIAGTGAIVAYTLDDGYLDYVFIDLGEGGTYSGSSSSSDLIYILEYDTDGADSVNGDYNEFYRYKAIVNGKIDQKIKFEKGASTLPAGLYTDIEYDSDSGFVSSSTPVTDGDDFTVATITAVESQKSGVITFTTDGGDNAKFYLADDGCTIYVIKLDGSDYDETVTVSAKTLYNEYKDDVTKLYGVKNDDGDYTALYVVVAE
jgi:hypothetical protein